jgi:hypothetical protein
LSGLRERTGRKPFSERKCQFIGVYLGNACQTSRPLKMRQCPAKKRHRIPIFFRALSGLSIILSRKKIVGNEFVVEAVAGIRIYEARDLAIVEGARRKFRR